MIDTVYTTEAQCIVCEMPLRVINANRRKTVHTHPGECRRLYHNYRMAKLRGNKELARKNQAIWELTRSRQRATKKTLQPRSRTAAHKGRNAPVRPRIRKKGSGSLL